MIVSGLRIGLFGGSFDPVHVGHQRVAESFLKSNLIDELHLLPTAHPPHKENKSSTSFYHRSQMLKLAFSGYEHVVVNEIENSLPKPSYTLQTIEHLQNAHPENLFYLCIGEDNLASFHKWYKYKSILQKVTLIVAGRPGTDIKSQQSEILERSILIDHEEIEVSSSDIRNQENSGEMGKAVPESVIDYIKQHNLYAD
ncbi:nicotinate (nicotinamide) nucleotide adenylyltransferase [soil metagenome]